MVTSGCRVHYRNCFIFSAQNSNFIRCSRKKEHGFLSMKYSDGQWRRQLIFPRGATKNRFLRGYGWWRATPQVLQYALLRRGLRPPRTTCVAQGLSPPPLTARPLCSDAHSHGLLTKKSLTLTECQFEKEERNADDEQHDDLTRNV